MNSNIYKAGGIKEVMRKLTKKEREKLEDLLERSFQKKNGYWTTRKREEGRYKSYKRSRILMQIHLNKKLEIWELVHHKDGNKENDDISNLEVLNGSEHMRKHHENGDISGKKPEGWKPANTTDPETVKRIQEIAKEMVKINCLEIKRRLEKEGIKISGFTISKYL